MDDNTLAQLAALEQVVCSLQAQLDTTWDHARPVRRFV